MNFFMHKIFTIEKNTLHLFLLSIGITLATILMVQDFGTVPGCVGIGSSETFNCHSVVDSDPLKLIGLSSSVVGAIYFIMLYIITVWIIFQSKSKERKSNKNVKRFFIVSGFVFITGLTIYHLIFLNSLCLYCIGVFVVTLLLMLSEFLIQSKTNYSSFYKVVYTLVPLMITAVPFLISSSLNQNLETTLESNCNIRDVISDQDYKKVINGGFKVGNQTARQVVVEYFSPLCSHCRTFYPKLEKLVKKYSDRVLFVFKPVLLSPSNKIVHNALYKAAEKDKFRELLKLIYQAQNNGKITKQTLKKSLSRLGIYSKNNWNDIKNGFYNDILLKERKIAFKEIGIKGTPSIFLNKGYLKDFNSLDDCLKLVQ